MRHVKEQRGKRTCGKHKRGKTGKMREEDRQKEIQQTASQPHLCLSLPALFLLLVEFLKQLELVVACKQQHAGGVSIVTVKRTPRAARTRRHCLSVPLVPRVAPLLGRRQLAALVLSTSLSVHTSL